jgi:parvulin-like peptidyl-prolyl isomerase
MACTSEAELEQSVALSLKTEKLVEDIRTDVPGPTPDQIETYYNEHPDEFEIPARVTCAHIVKHVNWQCNEAQAAEIMQQVKAELDQGTPFASVAAKYSDCPDNGGSLGQIQRGQMVEEFEDIIFNLGPNQVSDIFQTRFGYHIATVYDSQPASIAPLDEVRGEIKKVLHEQLKTDKVYAFIDALKEKATIETPDD